MPGTGSGKSDAINVGQVMGARGNFGEIKVKVLSDVPNRFDTGQDISIDGKTYPITASKYFAPGQIALMLGGVDTVNGARELNGHWITVSEQLSPDLPKDEYFHFQLIGLRVVTEDGEELGSITEIIQTGSNDVYLVTGESSEILIPALGHVILNVDLDEELMTVHLMDGLR